MTATQRGELHELSRRVRQVLDSFLDERMQGSWPVSVTLTTLAMRQRVVDCGLSDRELAELVAIRVLERGYHVVFDTDLLDDR